MYNFKETLGIEQELIELKEKIERLTAKIDDKKIDLKNSFFPYIQKIYKDWRPEIGDIVVEFDLSHHTAQELMVSSLKGNTLRYRESPYSGSRINLEIKKEEYHSTRFVLPLQKYKEIEDRFQKKFDYSKLEYRKEVLLRNLF